jgi:hypothetical protein
LREDLASTEAVLMNCKEVMLTNEQQIMRELDRMDEIYYHVERQLQV